MEWLVILVSVLNVALVGYIVFLALKIKNGALMKTVGRVKPMIEKGKGIADVGKRELGENKERAQAAVTAFKSIAESVRPAEAAAGPKTQISYRTIMTAFAILKTVRSTWARVQTVRKPVANAPGPANARRGSRFAGLLPARRYGALGIIPDLMRYGKILRDVRKTIR